MSENNNKDTKQCTLHSVMRIPIEDHWRGGYRIEYDGKYVALYGGDANYKGMNYGTTTEDWYEEMVLVPIVIEERGLAPTIKDVTKDEILLDLGYA
jgi:hypothetical protein